MARQMQPGTQAPPEHLHSNDIVRDPNLAIHTEDHTSTIRPATSPLHNAANIGTVDVFDRDDTRYVTAPEPDPLSTSTVPSRSGAGLVAWIIGAIVLIALIYMLLQWVF